VLTAGPSRLTRVCGVLPRHEGRSGRCAEGRHVVAVQDDAVVGQRVDIRCWDLRGAVEAHVVPSLNGRHNTG
jgi:hypothetical protein